MKCQKHQFDSKYGKRPEHYGDCPTCKRIWDRVEQRRAKKAERRRWQRRRKRPKIPTKTKLRRRADQLFSKIVRMRGPCVRCGGVERLQASHVVSRQYYAVRWNEENADVLCAACHFWLHHFPVESRRWHEAKWPGRMRRMEDKALSGERPDLVPTVKRLEKRLQELLQAREKPYPSELDEVRDAKREET